MITIISCGLTNGPPPAATLTYDCRSMPDPSPVILDLPGTTPGVLDLMVEANPMVRDVLDFLVGAVWSLAGPAGGEDVTLVLVCSAGWHRSVAVAQEVARRLTNPDGPAVTVCHRDLVGVGS